jgi:hypothetical protein
MVSWSTGQTSHLQQCNQYASGIIYMTKPLYTYKEAAIITLYSRVDTALPACVHEMSSNFQSACMYVTYTTNEQKMYET